MGGKDQQPCAIDPTEPGISIADQQLVHGGRAAGSARTPSRARCTCLLTCTCIRKSRASPASSRSSTCVTGKTVWEIPDPYPNWGGALVTDGGLAFYGNLRATSAQSIATTGKVLWAARLGSGIIGNPITYKVGGKQYVSVWSGIGGWIGLPVTAGLDLNDKFGAIGATAMTKAANLDKIPQGGTLYTFRVGGMSTLDESV